MDAPKLSRLGTRLLINILTYHGIFWNLRPLKIAASAKISWQVGVAVDLYVQGCIRSSAQETNKNKKVTSPKLEQGLNFTVNGDFLFCNDAFCKKKLKAKRRKLLSFFYDV